MNQIALLRAVVTAFEFSDSRKLMSDVLRRQRARPARRSIIAL